MDQRSLIDERHIEFDALAIIVLGLGFALVSAVAGAVIGNAAGRFDAATWSAGGGVGAAVIGAWIFGYPRQATAPSIALVLVIAMVVIPRMIHLGETLTPEAAAIPPVYRNLIGGLYASGLMLVLLGFLLCGFFGPFISGWLRLRRRETGAREALLLHAGLFGAACAVFAVGAVMR